jgi:hypothetical protein
MEERPRVPSRLEEEEVVVLAGDVVAERAVTRRDQMRVGVDQPRQQSRVAIIQALHRPSVWRVDVTTLPQAGDAVTVEEQRRILQGDSLRPVKQARSGQQPEARIGYGHGVS